MIEYPLCVGAIVLTYNSTDDLSDCLTGLATQTAVDLRVIVVDNASHPEARAQMQAQFHKAYPQGLIVPVGTEIPPDTQAVFLCNDRNAGYSAGNNIGARVATGLGCGSVLIINPDVRLGLPDHVATLARLVQADPRTAVACSAVRNLAGTQENPMTEPGLVAELLWPVRMVVQGLWRRSPRQSEPGRAVCRVDKVSGACFLIRSDFLARIGYFDEGVFLYCEESILMAQVRAAGCHMVMDPRIEALHAHRSTAKGNPLRRFQAWMTSRAYFHDTHGTHGLLARRLLAASRRATLGLVSTREALRRLRSSAR